MSAQRQRIIQLAKELTPPMEIARIEGIDQSKIYSILRYERSKGNPIPYFKTMPEPGAGPIERPKQIVVGLRLWRLLEHAAERRGVLPEELARDLLEGALLRKAVRHG